MRSKESRRKEFVTNEERKPKSKREERDKGRYYKGTMCHLLCEICGLFCHTHQHTLRFICQRQVTSPKPLCAYLSLCDEMGGDGECFTIL